MDNLKFADLDLEPSLFDGIDALGFEEATAIQSQAIPLILAGKDLIACAQTGTGKTAAFLIPTINFLAKRESEHTRALVLTPTRELAEQIDQNVDALSYFTGVSSTSVYGGKNPKDFDRQRYGVANGSDIIVATPGRLKSFLALGTVDFSHLEIVVLDEADKMMDMGFYADIITIFSYLPDDRQTLMFSATMPPKIRKLTKEILKEPAEVNLNVSKPAEGVDQSAYMVYPEQKLPLLAHLLKTREIESMIIFASSKSSVDQITRQLTDLSFDAKAIHSDKEQSERQETLRLFKNKQFPILIGTDVLSRGIDIDNLSHVLNYDVPHDAEDYVHRVGRTARAKSTGEAITFISPRDQKRFARIEELIESTVPKPVVPEELGETPTYNPRTKGKGGRPNRGGGGGGGNRGRRPQGKRQGGGQGGGQNRNRSRNRKNNRSNGPGRNGNGNASNSQKPNNRE